MSIILGVDIGGSTTKIVGLREDGSLLSTLRVAAGDQLTSLYGGIGNYLNQNRLSLGDVGKIVLTGVGAALVHDDIYGIPTEKVSEFTAIGCGGLALSKRERAVVVSMGTGTAFVWATPEGVRHLGGSGVGGGTLLGLCALLTGSHSTEQIEKLLSLGGDLGRIDLTVGDLSQDENFTLNASVTAANFGKVADDASPADLALGVTNMVMEVLGTIAYFACERCQTKTAVLVGSFTDVQACRDLLDHVSKLYGIEMLIPQNAAFAPAIGAALQSIR